uniref:Uncharacterized protein n=1 Tax=Anguilla anguilla TaxID=7936 RepID=A0A0E9WNX0_ANGAN
MSWHTSAYKFIHLKKKKKSCVASTKMSILPKKVGHKAT